MVLIEILGGIIIGYSLYKITKSFPNSYKNKEFDQNKPFEKPDDYIVLLTPPLINVGFFSSLWDDVDENAYMWLRMPKLPLLSFEWLIIYNKTHHFMHTIKKLE